MFEGGCIREMERLGRFMHLDYGPCGIDGPTDPVQYENPFIDSKVEIPHKCSDCVFLYYDSIGGFECRKDNEKWGDFRRGLDWGGWKPDRIYIQLPFPKVTTKALIDAMYSGNQIAFLKEYRRINPSLPYSEAKEDFECLRTKARGAQDKGN
jgi:hypothetical protein